MKDNWSDPGFATEWDTEAAHSNPTRSLLLDLLATIVTDAYVEGNKILDLGFGSGHVENRLFQVIPHVEIVGIDASDVMIAKAQEKLKYSSTMTIIKHDLNDISKLILPSGNYQIALTSFVLHEVDSTKKREIFDYIYKTLMSQGMYILVDRFKINSGNLHLPYSSQWNWQKKQSGAAGTKSFDSYVQEMTSKEDSPDSMEDMLAWLREAGFKAACLQLQLDRGLIVGMKD